jgi:hypothetical protein
MNIEADTELLKALIRNSTFIFGCDYKIVSLILWLPGMTQVTYRVSIKSFPDYKHLLQENNNVQQKEYMLKCTNML